VFETPSHAGEPARGATVLHDVCAATTLPVIAIGGVRPEHVAALLADGAYGVAVIRGIWRADDAESAAAEYLSAYDAVPHAGPSGGA
jgi:thiamine monophosphate synthase